MNIKIKVLIIVFLKLMFLLLLILNGFMIIKNPYQKLPYKFQYVCKFKTFKKKV